MTMKLKKEVKEMWLKALRSGEYTQARGTLRNKTGFCCLGVLCDLHDKKGWELRFSFVPTYKGETALPPDEVFKWAAETEPKIEHEVLSVVFSSRLWNELSSMNDSGFSFLQIADTIEKDW